MNTRTAARRRHSLTAGSVTLISALLLTACGSDDGNGGSGGSGTRTVDTAMGEVEVPADPERVVVLDTPELDSALTLGVTPVGAVRADVADGFLGYLPEGFTEDIENVGNIAAPNLEAIAELNPDLIISNQVRDEERYAELSEIAPTVLGTNPGGPWQENFLIHAAALNKEAEAEAAIAAYQDQIDQVVTALGGPEAAAATEVSVLRFMEGADSRIYGRENYIGTILADLGVGRPAIVDDAADGFAVEVSGEQIDLADGDVLYYTSYGDTTESGESDLVGSALWESMTAVRDDRAYHVDDELWFLGIGYTAASLILDDIAETLPAD